jgi:hypothetical protein
MKRGWYVLALVAALALVATQPASAQMGMDMFKRPAITKVFHPVVGRGAAYLSTDKDGKTRNSEISIVGKDSVDGKDGFWMEFVADDHNGKPVVGKALITLGDFQFHRMIVQPAGQQAMELPGGAMSMAEPGKAKMEEFSNDWNSVGTETITVPAGTFSCEHWRNNKNNADSWTSDKITPLGLVKETHSGGGMVLIKVLDNATDRITGPIRQFDMQQMMQQLQQQHQQKPQS